MNPPGRHAARSTDPLDEGAAADLLRLRLLDRRCALGLLGGVGGMAALSAIHSGVTAAVATCVPFSHETVGPFPADGTNRATGATSNVLTMDAFRREDIRSSLIGRDTVAEGVPVELVLTLASVAGCAPLPGHVVYLWQNDARGRYSLYDLPDESYLRGVQAADAAGRVRFTTVFPGCYGGRYPHMHFQVFSSLGAASTGRESLLASQLALPSAECADVYADAQTYGDSMANLERTSLTRDFIFRDNSPAGMEAMTLDLRGSPAGGYAGSATIALPA